MAIANYVTKDFLKQKVNEQFASMETMFIGSIISVDTVNMRYSVQPVLKDSDIHGSEVDRAILFSCPMMTMKCRDFYIRAPYQVNDMVYVGVSKYSVDESIINSSSRTNRVNGVRNFRMIDGIILGGVLSDEEPRLSSSNSEDLILENRGNGDRIVMTKSGGLELYTSINVKIDSPTTHVTGNVQIDGELTVSGNITGESDLLINGAGKIVGALQAGAVKTDKGTTLDGHTHSYNPGPSPPAQTGSGNG